MPRTVMIHQYGLPEYEGRHYFDVWGRGEGSTLIEIVNDIVSKNPDKAKYLKFQGEKAYDWGFPLNLLEEEA